jgi:hypothetical protein
MNATHAALVQGLYSSSWKSVPTGFVVGLGLLALLALVSGAHAQSQTAPSGGARPSLPPNAIPLNIPGTYTLPPPPAGFDPETASPAALQTHGVPPAPDKQANPKAYASWLNAVSIPNRIAPVLEKTTVYHRPLLAAPAGAPLPIGAEQESQKNENITSAGSYNWSGFAVYNSAGPFQIEAVVGSYVVPVARNPFGQCPNHPQDDVWSSNWVGINGLDSTNALFQHGVEADSYNDCAGSYQYYAPWIEWIPGPEYRVLNAPVGAGDYIYTQNWTETTSTGCFFWANQSEQWAGSVCTSASALGGNPVTGTSVEWILERPYTGEHASGLAYLTNYVTVPWWETFAYNYTASSPTYNYPGSSPSGTVYQFYSVDDSGSLISYPFLVGTDSTFFYDYGSAYCAPSASCVPRY